LIRKVQIMHLGCHDIDIVHLLGLETCQEGLIDRGLY